LKHNTKNDPPVPGATVYLAKTTDPEVPVKGCQATTDEDGTYKFDRVDLLATADPEGIYVLVVKKAGFEPLFEEFGGIGYKNGHMQNTVILKKKGKSAPAKN
jgi:hypothetical protein